jgi:hypothetical protein
MIRPTPEQWWSDMSGADRARFMDEVAPGARVSLDLWMKLRGVGIIAAGSGYGDHGWEYYLPAEHLSYVLSRAAERGSGDADRPR